MDRHLTNYSDGPYDHDPFNEIAAAADEELLADRMERLFDDLDAEAWRIGIDSEALQ
jgi:hypothetical protein